MTGLPFIVGGPLGLLIAIFLSFWVSSQSVLHTVTIHVETQWKTGESLAIRAQWVSERPTAITGSGGEAWVEQGAARHALVTFSATPRDGLVQGTFAVPSLQPGPAELHVRLVADGIETREEVIPVAIVEQRAARTPVPLLVRSHLQHGDDTDPQPQGVRIDVIPAGRWITQFENRVYVRVLHPDGRPYEGLVEVFLASGEFMGHGKAAEPVQLAASPMPRWGWFSLEGLLTSEVVRLEVRVMDANKPGHVLHRRRVYLVTHAGGVRVDASPEHARPGPIDLEVKAYGFSRTRPVFVDVHAPDGAWIGTIEPPFVGAEPPRPWVGELEQSGLLQFEAYHFTNAPGASTAFRRVLLEDADPASSKSLEGLLSSYRTALSLRRADRDYDAKIEGQYLDWIATNVREPDDVARTRTYLLDTLPAALFGPPTALVTREQDHETMLALKRRWTLGIRWFLLGGGALFLALMTTMMMLDHMRALRTTTEAMQTLDLVDEASAGQELRRAARSSLVRGLIMVAIIAGGLVLTIFVLENLFWVR